ncbi:hypothetical protein LIER_26221 [Lithospermum erythrorhizon]|uniref:C2 domain-containing protein n=1 Tax=Lithospermum erythrorhizon TaxID=34254 RepID=A0AAV3R7L9_LITER
MDSPQSVVSPFKGSGGFEKQINHHFVENAGCLTRGNGVQRKEALLNNLGEIIGILDVFVHQARDIHNICIYHKQDVYARICLTSDPENAVSTKTINGGGQSPVFNDALKLNVRNVETSLKCEIWMLSRVKNYLEDQLLGFALVPLAEVLISNGKLEKEFSLSSTDLFHSPAGYVKLSLSYSGASPEVFAIPAPSASVGMDTPVQDAEPHALVPTEFDKIEFPDPQIVNQNNQMVSEYYGIPCTSLDSNSCSDNDNKISFEVGSQFVESFSTCTINAAEVPKPDSPPSIVSTDGFPSTSLPVSTHSSDSPKSFDSDKKNADTGDSVNNASGILPTVVKPSVSVNFEPEHKMLQQDFVDMYMKSMQQFTESLEKMKLPLDIDHGPTSSGNSSSDQTSQTPKNSGARVFYGSRAFF